MHLALIPIHGVAGSEHTVILKHLEYHISFHVSK